MILQYFGPQKSTKRSHALDDWTLTSDPKLIEFWGKRLSTYGLKLGDIVHTSLVPLKQGQLNRSFRIEYVTLSGQLFLHEVFYKDNAWITNIESISYLYPKDCDDSGGYGLKNMKVVVVPE